MKLLLDTNALIWLLSQADGRSFGPKAKQLIVTADAVYVSSVSVLEIRIKTMLGKLNSDSQLLSDIQAAGLRELPFSISHADAIRNFPDLSRHDPFDRMLLAQAQTDGLALLTSDTLLLVLNYSYVTDSCQ